MKIGIDVGGTFTDFLLVNDDGSLEVYKVLSTPGDPSVGLLNGLTEMARSKSVELNEFIKGVEIIVHGTTVTTNAVLTYNGAKTALLTTKGLRDALEMRRGIREEQYNNRYANVKPLVPRYLRYPIEERLDYKGDVVTTLNNQDVMNAVELFKRENVEALAICFMNSFASKTHEELAEQIIKEHLPNAYLTVSSKLLPSIRFYDRISTTVLNSYVGPILKRYLNSLVDKLKNIGFAGVLLIMQSNGGVVSPEIATDSAAVTLLSGPAGGPVAGITYTSIQGYNDCITIDMGGTSFDAALIKDKTPLVTTEGEVNRLRLALPMLAINTIGAGGGSIGWIDEGGLLRMGPQSAGAKPGPACYDLGGELPTCTDADLILGYLNKDYFAGGKILLDYDKALKAIEEHVAEKLNLSVPEAAAGMYSVINVNMASGVREVSVKRGYDPREFPLVVAGGAGPIHSCMIALELEIPIMIVPRESSIFCAAGMLMSDLKHDFVRTYSTPITELDMSKLKSIFDEMRQEGSQMLSSENISDDKVEFHYSLDMRYIKQYHEVNVNIGEAELDASKLNDVLNRFHKEHDKLYGYSLEAENAPVELINARLTCLGRTDKPKFMKEQYASEDASNAVKAQRKVYLPDIKDFEQVDIFDGAKLQFGNKIVGPALIEQVNTTTFVAREYNLICDGYGSYTMYLKHLDDKVVRRVVE